MTTTFTGMVRIPGSIENGLPSTITLDAQTLVLTAGGTELGRWNRNELTLRREPDGSFHLTLGREVVLFNPDSPLEFAILSGMPGAGTAPAPAGTATAPATPAAPPTPPAQETPVPAPAASAAPPTVPPIAAPSAATPPPMPAAPPVAAAPEPPAAPPVVPASPTSPPPSPSAPPPSAVPAAAAALEPPAAPPVVPASPTSPPPSPSAPPPSAAPAAAAALEPPATPQAPVTQPPVAEPPAAVPVAEPPATIAEPPPVAPPVPQPAPPPASPVSEPAPPPMTSAAGTPAPPAAAVPPAAAFELAAAPEQAAPADQPIDPDPPTAQPPAAGSTDFWDGFYGEQDEARAVASAAHTATGVADAPPAEAGFLLEDDEETADDGPRAPRLGGYGSGLFTEDDDGPELPQAFGSDEAADGEERSWSFYDGEDEGDHEPSWSYDEPTAAADSDDNDEPPAFTSPAAEREDLVATSKTARIRSMTEWRPSLPSFSFGSSALGMRARDALSVLDAILEENGTEDIPRSFIIGLGGFAAFLGFIAVLIVLFG